MPVEVPKEPKKYTTVYDNFKGVDFTNDASNVYRRRSPTGVNMLPDLDGRPHKRTGWDIKFSKQDFIEAAGIVGTDEVIPLRTHYFSYGGHDFIMVFNSLGVFWIRDDSDAPQVAKMWDGTSEGVFPPMGIRKIDGVSTEVQLTADHNRAFFFEGGGTSGFYVFVDDDLYKFGEVEGGRLCFTNVTPLIPVVLIGATPRTAVGTSNQAINMLTEARTIEYFGDGTATYALVSAVASVDDVAVQVLDADTGEWRNVPQDDSSSDPNYSWRLDDNIKVVFTATSPPASVVGNVRITYIPNGTVSYSVVPDTETGIVKYTITQISKERQYRDGYEYFSWNKNKKTWVSTDTVVFEPYKWQKPFVASTSNKAVTVKFPSPFRTDNIKIMSNFPGSGYTDQTSKFKLKFNAYNGTASVLANNNLRDQAIAAGTKTVKTGSWFTSARNTEIADKSQGYRSDFIEQVRERTTTTTKTFYIYGVYDKAVTTRPDLSAAISRDAFSQCRKTLNFGNDIYNQVFIASSTAESYRNRAWYCAANNPAYFPDTNYIEVGSDDKEVMGLQKMGSYLGIVKKGSGTEASVYLAYPTSFEEDSTYAVKQSVSGIGAISNGAFNILNEEPLFLSEHGIMGVNINESDVNKQIRNRSFYINKRLLSETGLENAISFVHDGLYYLAINNHCYVLDGSQKSSWANEKTNLQYECYYLDNIPAQCFAKMGSTLYFADSKGNLCYFKRPGDDFAYIDCYLDKEAEWIATVAPVAGDDGDVFNLHDLGGRSDEYSYLIDSDADYICVFRDDTTIYSAEETYAVGDIVAHTDNGITSEYSCAVAIETPEEWTEEHWTILDPIRLMVSDGAAGINATVSYLDDYYTVIDTYIDKDTGDEMAIVSSGVPIYAEWSTIADDDEMVHFFKNLNKKGCVVSLLPGEGSYVRVLIKPDEKEPKDLGYIESGITELPSDMIVKKKIKKYKRLQFIIRDDWYNDGFALDQIIKTYTVGNYSKNRK